MELRCIYFRDGKRCGKPAEYLAGGNSWCSEHIGGGRTVERKETNGGD